MAIGALSFYIDHFVTSRVAKVSYGTMGSMLYKPNNPEHAKRKKMIWKRPSGDTMISGAFFPVVKRVCLISPEHFVLYLQGLVFERVQSYLKNESSERSSCRQNGLGKPQVP